MSELFARANQVGLGCVQSWLPGGRLEGDEWVCLNPTRHDDNAGSFKVNIRSGKWIENANGDGGDIVKLYAYLNREACEYEARMKKYHNIEGGVQAEAARAILEKYDPNYFPGDSDDFSAPTPTRAKKGQGWDDFVCVEKGLAAPPELDTTYFQKLWGTETARWDLYSGKGQIVMRIVRFIDDKGQKSDRPFTLWSGGGDVKWRAKALPGKYPLWNLLQLEARQTYPVVLFEGQKAAACAAAVIGDDYVCVGWYGGVNGLDRNDLEPLQGREVFFWPDADSAGRSVIRKLKKMDIKLHIIYVPSGVPKGWDVADAIAEKWSREDIIKLIEDTDRKTQGFLDENEAMPFRILGLAGDDIYFHCYQSKDVVSIKATGVMEKRNLNRLAPMKWWGTYYTSPNGGVAWSAAGDDIMRRAEVMKKFDPSVIRRSGAWKDGESVIFHAGEYLLINGAVVDLVDKNGGHIYERSRELPIDVKNPLALEQARELMSLWDYLPMSHKASRYLLSGFMALAPFGGALKWRPHIWITGKAGSGKSWLLENIIYKLVADEFGIKGMGTSTPAGIRQALNSTSLCAVLDEMESDNEKFANYIEQNLKMFREASSGVDGSAGTLHGTVDQAGKQWLVKSMACFASIGASLRQEADLDRFTLITLDTLDQDIEKRLSRFAELKKRMLFLNHEWARAFHGRTYLMIREVMECIEVMTEQAATILKSRRHGDQIGTLMAGAWMVGHDKSATAAEAMAWLTDMDIASINSVSEKRCAEERVIDELFASRVHLNEGHIHTNQTIGACLDFYFHVPTALETEEERKDFGVSDRTVKHALEQVGIKATKYRGSWIHIATGHPRIREILAPSGFGDNYAELLIRTEASSGAIEGPELFCGRKKRYVKLDAEKIMDLIPF